MIKVPVIKAGMREGGELGKSRGAVDADEELVPKHCMLKAQTDISL